MLNIARSEKAPQDEPAPAAEPQGEIRGGVRNEIASYRRQPGPVSEIVASDAHSLVERVSTSSTNEIDKLIAQLQTLRDFFRNEGQRIQREIAEYAQLGDAMLKSTRTMAESMAQLKHTGEIVRDEVE